MPQLVRVTSIVAQPIVEHSWHFSLSLKLPLFDTGALPKKTRIKLRRKKVKQQKPKECQRLTV